MLLFALSIACDAQTIVVGDKAGNDGGVDSAADSGAVDTGDTGGADSGDTDTGAAEDTDCTQAGVLVGSEATLVDGSTFNSYDGGGAYDAGRASSDASIVVLGGGACAVTNGAKVSGTVAVGGDVSSAYCEVWGEDVSGGVSEVSGKFVLPDVAIPAGMPAKDGDLTVAWSEVYTLDADAHFGTLDVQYGGAIEVSGEVSLVVDEFKNEGGSLTLEPGASLNLYVIDDATLNWGSAVNSGGSPDDLRISVMGNGTVNIAGGASIGARLFAPYAGVVLGGTFAGAVASDAFETQWGGAFHDDLSLRCP